MTSIQDGVVSVSRNASYHLALPEGSRPDGGWPAVLALHGYGDDGAGFAERLASLTDHGLAVVAPDGPHRLSVGSGSERRLGRAWYAYDGDQARFRSSLEEEEEALRPLVSEIWERHGLDPERSALLGYSMGGYLGSFVALRDPQRWRGLVAVACRVKVEFLAAELETLSGYPVYGLHGARDEATALEPQELAFERLRAAGLRASLRVHPGGHGFRRAEIPAVGEFLDEVLIQKGGDQKVASP